MLGIFKTIDEVVKEYMMDSLRIFLEKILDLHLNECFVDIFFFFKAFG